MQKDNTITKYALIGGTHLACLVQEAGTAHITQCCRAPLRDCELASTKCHLLQLLPHGFGLWGQVQTLQSCHGIAVLPIFKCGNKSDQSL